MSDRRPAAAAPPTAAAAAALQTQYQRYQAAQQQRARSDQQAATAVYAQYVSAFAPAVAAAPTATATAATTTRFVRGGLLTPGTTASSTTSTTAAPGTSYVLGRTDRDDWYNPESDDDDDDAPPPPPPPKRAAGDTLGAVFALGHAEEAHEGAPVTLSLQGTAETKAEEAEARVEDPDVDRELHRERERKRATLAQLQAQFAQQDQRRGHSSSSGGSSGGSSSSDRATTNVFVGNVTQRVTEADLFARFRAHGPIASVKIMRPRTPEERARLHTNGFVAFMCRRDAERAKAALDGALLDGCAMKLDWGSAVPLPPAPLCLARDPDTGLLVLRTASGDHRDDNDDDSNNDGVQEPQCEGDRALDADEAAALRAVLDGLTMANASVRHATGWCCDHSACARAVVRVLGDAFAAGALAHTAAPPVDAAAALLAKLFLVSDLLYNSSVVPAATMATATATAASTVAVPYRAALQDALPAMFAALAAPCETPANRVALLRLREGVARVLRTWERWAVLPQPYLAALRRACTTS